MKARTTRRVARSSPAASAVCAVRDTADEPGHYAHLGEGESTPASPCPLYPAEGGTSGPLEKAARALRGSCGTERMAAPGLLSSLWGVRWRESPTMAVHTSS